MILQDLRRRHLTCFRLRFHAYIQRLQLLITEHELPLCIQMRMKVNRIGLEFTFEWVTQKDFVKEAIML